MVSEGSIQYMDLEDRFRGAILGLAIGDALGMPVEGLSSKEIEDNFGTIDDFIPSPDGFGAGEWTDDTEEMLILSESIINSVYLDPHDFSRRLVSAMDLGKLIKAGPTTRRAIYNLQTGVPWSRSGVEADTCGAAMRVAPIGLIYNFSFGLVEKYAYVSSMVTHKGGAAIGGAVAVAVAIACICHQYDKESLLREVITKTEKYDKLVSGKIASRSVDGVSMYTWDAVPAAFYCFLTFDSYKECVLNAVNLGGDTDSIGAMAGAMKGAEVGIGGVPQRWIDGVKDSIYLQEMAEQLFRTFTEISSTLP
ncbi:MAG: ADP-ribosylglycohydrolase family protein [Archaeoglobaceae archaeon]